jgi:hypothetical protein
LNDKFPTYKFLLIVILRECNVTLTQNRSLATT